MISAIVAVDKRNGIGKNGDLLFAIPKDMERFIEITQYKTIVMGRKTFDSIGGKPLPARTNVVITHNEQAILSNARENLEKIKNCDANETYASLVVTNMETVKAYITDNINSKSESEIVIIGGGEIYKELLPYCDTVYLTRYYDHFDADTHFPVLKKDEWQISYQSEYKQHLGKRYKFFTYKRTPEEIKM